MGEASTRAPVASMPARADRMYWKRIAAWWFDENFCLRVGRKEEKRNTSELPRWRKVRKAVEKKKKTNGCSAGKEKRSVTEALRVEILFEFISMIDEQSRGVEKDMMEAWKFDGSEMGQVSQGCHQKLKVVRWSKRAALLFQWRTEISDGRNGERRKRNNQPPKEEQTGHERLFG